MSTDEMRMISLVLFDAGMNAREEHWREDVNDFSAIVVKQMVRHNKAQNFAKSQKTEVKAKGIILNFRQEQERFNLLVNSYVDKRHKALTELDPSFNEFSRAFRQIIDEITKGKDIKEVLTVLQAYNMGHLDNLLISKNERNNESSENTSDLVPTENAIAINADGYHEPLQEGSKSTAERTAYPEHGC